MLISRLIMYIKFFFMFSILSLNASANEVGNKIFVVNPIAKPIYTSKSGTKFYPCDGYVNKKLIPIKFLHLMVKFVIIKLELLSLALDLSQHIVLICM